MFVYSCFAYSQKLRRDVLDQFYHLFISFLLLYWFIGVWKYTLESMDYMPSFTPVSVLISIEVPHNEEIIYQGV